MSGLIRPYTLSIIDTNGNVGTESRVWAYNRTNKEVLYAKFDSNSKAIIEMTRFKTAVSDGDVIEIRVNGKYEGFTTHTVSLSGSNAGFADISIATAAVSTSLNSINV